VVLLTVITKELTAILKFMFIVLVACTSVAVLISGFEVDMSADNAVSTFDIVLDVVSCCSHFFKEMGNAGEVDLKVPESEVIVWHGQ